MQEDNQRSRTGPHKRESSKESTQGREGSAARVGEEGEE